jgi:hypothetical protein
MRKLLERRSPVAAWQLMRRHTVLLLLAVAITFLAGSAEPRTIDDNGCMTEMEEQNASGTMVWHGGEFDPPNYHSVCDPASPHQCEFLEETETAPRHMDNYHGDWEPGTYDQHEHEQQAGGNCGAW